MVWVSSSLGYAFLLDISLLVLTLLNFMIALKLNVSFLPVADRFSVFSFVCRENKAHEISGYTTKVWLYLGRDSAHSVLALV